MVLLTKSCPLLKNNSDAEQKRPSVVQPRMAFSALHCLTGFDAHRIHLKPLRSAGYCAKA